MRTKNFTTVEVVSAGATVLRHSLPTNQNLQGARKITAIQAYKVGEASQAPVSGAAVVNDTVFDKSFLVLTANSGAEIIDRIPLADLNRALNGGQLTEFEIDPVNMTKSYIQVSSIASQVGTEVWLLGVHFEK